MRPTGDLTGCEEEEVGGSSEGGFIFDASAKVRSLSNYVDGWLEAVPVSVPNPGVSVDGAFDGTSTNDRLVLVLSLSILARERA